MSTLYAVLGSGGGKVAAAFELGVILGMHRLGVLSNVTALCSTGFANVATMMIMDAHCSQISESRPPPAHVRKKSLSRISDDSDADSLVTDGKSDEVTTLAIARENEFLDLKGLYDNFFGVDQDLETWKAATWKPWNWFRSTGESKIYVRPILYQLTICEDVMLTHDRHKTEYQSRIPEFTMGCQADKTLLVYTNRETAGIGSKGVDVESLSSLRQRLGHFLHQSCQLVISAKNAVSSSLFCDPYAIKSFEQCRSVYRARASDGKRDKVHVLCVDGYTRGPIYEMQSVDHQLSCSWSLQEAAKKYKARVVSCFDKEFMECRTENVKTIANELHQDARACTRASAKMDLFLFERLVNWGCAVYLFHYGNIKSHGVEWPCPIRDAKEVAALGNVVDKVWAHLA